MMELAKALEIVEPIGPTTINVSGTIITNSIRATKTYFKLSGINLFNMGSK